MLHHVKQSVGTDVLKEHSASISWSSIPRKVKLKAQQSSEMLVTIYQLRQHNTPADTNIQHHHCDNLKSHIIFFLGGGGGSAFPLHI
jgi:hypothetical protein